MAAHRRDGKASVARSFRLIHPGRHGAHNKSDILLVSSSFTDPGSPTEKPQREFLSLALRACMGKATGRRSPRTPERASGASEAWIIHAIGRRRGAAERVECVRGDRRTSHRTPERASGASEAWIVHAVGHRRGAAERVERVRGDRHTSPYVSKKPRTKASRLNPNAPSR